MSVPASLTELPSPANLFSVQSKVFSDPLYGVGVSSVLGGTEFLVESSRVATETDSSLRPRVSPPESLVVVDALTQSFPVVSYGAEAVRVLWSAKEGYVNPAQSHMEADVCFNLMSRVRSVLSPRMEGVRVPGISEVAH